jgi:hypothetical protein
MIGFDPNTGLAYEGLGNHGHGLWPAPLVMRATFVEGPDEWGKVPSHGDLRDAQCVFREDYFDPVTRVRRGRFYDIAGARSQPDAWWVHKHPVLPEEVGERSHAGLFSKQLLTFTPMRGVGQRLGASREMVVVLGARPAVTVWTVVSVERAGSDEDVVTLRARLNFGYLPDLRSDAVPADARERVAAAVNKVVDAAHRQSGIALVDLCRDAATVVLSEYLVAHGQPRTLLEKDLGAVVSALPEQSKIQRSAAEIIRLLHPRGKSNEQVRLGVRGVTEADGVFALEALRFLLRDIGWAQ